MRLYVAIMTFQDESEGEDFDPDVDEEGEEDDEGAGTIFVDCRWRNIKWLKRPSFLVLYNLIDQETRVLCSHQMQCSQKSFQTSGPTSKIWDISFMIWPMFYKFSVVLTGLRLRPTGLSRILQMQKWEGPTADVINMAFTAVSAHTCWMKLLKKLERF